MAKALWLSVSPDSGSGNDTTSVTGDNHTGRNQRTSDLTYKASGKPDVVVPVTQSGRNEFVTLGNVSAPKSGGNVTVSGKSNSSKLTFSLGSGDITVSLPASYSAAGANTNNAAAIGGDPGAVAEFNFSIEFSIPATETIVAKSKIVTVTANGGQQASATISQAAGEPTLSVYPTSITLDADGNAVTVSVTSNTNWTVS